MALAGSPTDREPVWLDRQCIQPVGFARDEGMFPYATRLFLGYRLLSELFCFPQKFLFLDITGLGPTALAKAGNQLEIYIYLNRSSIDLEQNVTASTLKLGCSPIVNLYQQRCEPVALTHRSSEYRIVPDVAGPLAHEIYAVDRVVATSPNNEQFEYRPFYSFKHGGDRRQAKRFWHARRQRAESKAGHPDPGTEIYLSLVDLDFSPSAPVGWTLDVETTCLNRDLPHRLTLPPGQSCFRLTQGSPLALSSASAAGPRRPSGRRTATGPCGD